MAVYGSVLDLIGNTPLLDISSLSPNPRVRLLAKLEGLPDEGRDAVERLPGAQAAARGVGRRDHRVTGERGLERRRAHGAAPGRRAPRVRLPLPVRQPGQPQGALRGHRPRDLARLP